MDLGYDNITLKNRSFDLTKIYNSATYIVEGKRYILNNDVTIFFTPIKDSIIIISRRKVLKEINHVYG